MLYITDKSERKMSIFTKSLLAITVAIPLVACGSEQTTYQAPPAIVQQPTQQVVNTAPQVTQSVQAQQMIGVQQAIRIAEQHSNARAVEVELQQGYGNAVYDVETITKSQEHRVQINALTGEVLSSYSEKELNIKPQPKLGLVDAINIALKTVSGQVLEASLDNEVVGSEYDVKVLSVDNQPYEIKIKASNGQVIYSRIDYDD